MEVGRGEMGKEKERDIRRGRQEEGEMGKRGGRRGNQACMLN